MALWCCVLVLLVSPPLIHYVAGLSLQECNEGWFTVSETGQNGDNELTCTGIGSSDTVTWQFTPPGAASPAEISSCPPLPSSCTNTLGTVTASQPAPDSSQLTFSSPVLRALAGAPFYCYTDNTNRQQCHLHLVFYPSSVSCTVQFNTDVTPWTVSGSCNVTKIYSSRDQYSCQWSQSSGSSRQVIDDVTMTTSPNPQDSSYKDGRCTMVGQPLPASDGTYTYTVMTSPGSAPVTAVFTGASVVRTPSTPSITDCMSSTYIPELSRLECTCSTDDVGSPAGRVQWSPASPPQGADSSRLVLANVSRGDNGSEYQCQVRWNQQTLQSQSSYTVRVAYGPYQDSVSITISNITNDVFDTDGSLDLRVMCQYTDVSPTPDITWLDPASCRGQGHTCTFRPQPPSDVTVRCQVTNSQNNGKTQTVSRTVVLNYPPPSPPLITGYAAGTPLYMSDSLTLTCDVSGGQPEVTSVNLTCRNHLPSVTSGAQSSLIVSSLRSDDHDTTCVCSAEWKVSSLYSNIQSVSLTVYSPPNQPSITRQSPALYPYMEGDRPTLRCSSSEGGVPSATYMWSGRRPGDTVTPSAGGSQLDMATLTSTDNGNTINCTASNDFTIRRGHDVTTSQRLNVYYGPYLSLSQTDGNACMLASDTSQCTVQKGRRVHLRCDVDSNPAPNTYTWRALNDSDLLIATGLFLDIFSIRRNQSGLYSVAVETFRPGSSDPRLPLASQLEFQIFVTGPVHSVHLTLNSQPGVLEVPQNHSGQVTFTCTAAGPPAPTLVLTDDQEREIARLTGDSADVSTGVSVLTYVMTSVRCEDSSVYTCTADNGRGPQVSATATLRVLCKMQIMQDSFDSLEDGVPVFIAENHHGEFHFQVLTTQTPHTASFRHLGSESSGIGQPPLLGLLSMRCEATSLAYKSDCVITADNVSESTIGYYAVTVATTTDSVTFTFRLLLHRASEDSRQAADGPGLGAGIGIGVGISVLVALLSGAVVWYWRRRRRPRSENAQSGHPQNEEHRQQHEMSHSAQAMNEANPYSELTQNDIGVKSVYSAMTSGASAPAATQPDSDGGYEIPERRLPPSASPSALHTKI